MLSSSCFSIGCCLAPATASGGPKEALASVDRSLSGPRFVDQPHGVVSLGLSARGNGYKQLLLNDARLHRAPVANLQLSKLHQVHDDHPYERITPNQANHQPRKSWKTAGWSERRSRAVRPTRSSG